MPAITSGFGKVVALRRHFPSLYLGELHLKRPFNERYVYAAYWGRHFIGTITKDGMFLGPKSGPVAGLPEGAKKAAWVLLRQLAELPKTTLAKEGQKTGRCACCGRALTDEESVKRGIGPICWERLMA